MLKYIFVVCCLCAIKNAAGECVGEFLKNHKNYRLFDRKECGRGYLERHEDRRLKEDEVEKPNAALLGEFPWLLQLTIYTIGDVMSGCSGALITERYALTAGQCIVHWDRESSYHTKYTKIKRIRSMIGEFDRALLKDCDNERCANIAYANYVTDIYLDPKFTLDPKFKDIALLRLRCRVKFDLYVKPVCLPFECDLKFANFQDVEITLAGWGINSDSASQNKTVKINTKVLNYNECNRTFTNRYKGSKLVYKDQQCSSVAVRASYCQVDYGSPATVVVRSLEKCDCTVDSGELFVTTDEERAVLVGVVTDGVTCSDPLSQQLPHYPPKTQTRVAPFIKWILDKMRA